MPIPVYCPHCGNAFASKTFHITGNVHGLTLIGNKETCPNCGQLANIQDGVFDFVNGILTQIRDAGLSRKSIMQLAALAPATKDEPVDEDAIIAAVEEIDPKIAAAFKTLKGKGKLAAMLMLLVFILSRCDFSLSATVDINELVDQLGGRGASISSPNNPSGGAQNTNSDKKAAKPNPTSGGSGEENINVTHGEPPKKKSRRRSDVNRKRRTELRNRREALNPRSR